MTTINKEEIQKFSVLADEWWDVEGKFKPLHMFNPARIEYILTICSSYFKVGKDLPLKNLKILISKYHIWVGMKLIVFGHIRY